MDKEQLQELNDRLADILCTNNGFKMALNSVQGGNRKQNDSLLEYAEYIEDKIRDSKRIIHKLISE